MTPELLEAAKRMRENKYAHIDDEYIDRWKLVNFAVELLDDSQITKELLIADGWKFNGLSFFMAGILICGNDAKGWYVRGIQVTTIGQVRTLLRVFG